ncbi:DEAD/DEAH box helicase [Nocardioides sp. AE5]|uniref:DEAD/DEAH box helicase n=1 Tax=Nocardioides sp. AE5 TaxID=2962573 RepID=UPI002882998D|nr:DEAD/DEAH box helicase [Nocardioides sp. AE5]MDT0203832.1 DEAD/DEAH box helicase [Nocardioides sp. AE5]
MKADFIWSDGLARDVEFGYLTATADGPRRHHPQVVLNSRDFSVLRSLREELSRSESFTFSVAFVSTRAIALLKQELVDFSGSGRIITSDYLAFNSPQAFAELLNLRQLGVDVRVHRARAFHPKGYIFEYPDGVTAIVGSSNLTENALVRNHEWNLKVSASDESDLARQIRLLVQREVEGSETLTQEWIDRYAADYTPPTRRDRSAAATEPDLGPGLEALPALLAGPEQSLPGTQTPPGARQASDAQPPRTRREDAPARVRILPNRMQRDALTALAQVRREGQQRAIVISATGTGKTMLSALDVRAVDPKRMLFVVHREQILDRTIVEYQKVLEAPPSDFGKLTGTTKQQDRRYAFATIQTLSRPDLLETIDPAAFDYVIIDEAHRAGAETYQRVLQHLTPRFLLGMTATPERTDGFNVFELFDYNVPYEIRLNHALEEEMLSPFHYYGVAEVTYDDGTTIDGDSDLGVLITPERVAHLLKAIEIYGQAGVPPRGLIFCSRKAEARELSTRLNESMLRGRTLRTAALTGEDSIPHREAMVRRLEAGELDYLLTVDVFNEGVDIPSINQVIMLRQTKSAIVFVQQLGRGLRKAAQKEYLVVIDVIGNYVNNFMIPIALFGDDSLDKESLRKNLIAAEESGVLPGLSSVRFDKVSQSRILAAISNTTLDSMQNLKAAMVAMHNRVGGAPALWDFLRFESVDPVLLATKRANYPSLVETTLKIDAGLTVREHKALGLLSHEVLTAKRPHEFALLDSLLSEGQLDRSSALETLRAAGALATEHLLQSTIGTFTLAEHAAADQNRYGSGVAHQLASGDVALTPEFKASYETNVDFARAVEDLLKTGKQIVADNYPPESRFVPGGQYSRKEACRILGWPRKWTSTIYGYRVDTQTRVCPIFVTLHKSDEISASTAYEDELLDRSTMRWFTRSKRTLSSSEVKSIVANEVDLHVFVKKDDAEGTDFYYLGQATSHDAEQTTMLNDKGESLSVVRMLLRFTSPIDMKLYDYFHPTITAVTP